MSPLLLLIGLLTAAEPRSGGAFLSGDDPRMAGEMTELRRRKEEGKYLTAALQSLEKLALEAERRRVFLGIENRYNLQDFPNTDELKVIFKEFPGSPVRYWHDLGHATTQENLGLVEKGELEPAVLKTELDRWDVFEEYQDRFLAMFKKKN